MEATETAVNKLYYGDNLSILRNRDYFPNECIDLIYLDPPFNSNRNYNVLFAEQNGSSSEAQIQAFADTWRWDDMARNQFNEIVEEGGRVADALLAFRSLVGESNMLAYLTMMAPRLAELRRVLKPTGSIYLHCDPTASQYLKLLMDSIFGPRNFRNEIVWKRSSPKSNVSIRFSRCHDILLFYGKSQETKFRSIFKNYDPSRAENSYRFVEEGTGRRYRLGNLTNPNNNRPNLTYEFKGVTRVWRWTKERMLEADAKGLIVVPKGGKGVPCFKCYLDEAKGVIVTDLWDDIGFVQGQAKERLGYPTQKPVTLLDRVIQASSQEGDTVLDPFCGCGTTIASAQRLKRNWIGIDITHLAITLIRSRLHGEYGGQISYEVIGEPVDIEGAKALAHQDRYQFQWWALGMVGARPVREERKKGADSGIDGKLFFREKENGSIKLMMLQVKSGKLKLSEVRDFAHVIERENAQIGVLLTLDEPTREMRNEAGRLGYYRPEYSLDPDTKYDRYQILSIREILEGKRPNYPPFRNVTFKAANPQPPASVLPKGRIKKLSESFDEED